MRIEIIEKISFILALNLLMIFSLSAQNNIDEYGQKQGKWVKYQNSRKAYEGQFVDDIPTGNFRYFYPSGNLKIKTTFAENGQLNRTKIYFDSFQEKVQAQGIYLNKKKDSTWNYYNKNGFLISIEHYKDGLKQGNFKVFNYEGQLTLEQQYVNDTLSGISTEYFESKNIFRQISYHAGIRQGEFKLYYPEGGLLLKGNYLNDIRDSIWTTYTKEGNIEFLDYYNKGLIQKRTDKQGNKLEFNQEEETKPLNIDPSVFDPTAIKR